MPVLTFGEVFQKLRDGDESVEIEAKRGSAIGRDVHETITAFSNEPDRNGGYILFGVVRDEEALFPDYHVIGVVEPDKLQTELATQCCQMYSTIIRPVITCEVAGDKNVLLVYIPEASAGDKPVYVKSKGVHHGAHRRIGSTDQVCTDDDIAMFYQARGQRPYDETPLPDSSLDDVDEKALAEYRRLRESINPGSDVLAYSDEDLLFALRALSRIGTGSCLTVAGLLLFGRQAALRRHMPLARVDYIRVEGREWVQDPAHRYQSVEKWGPLILVIPSIVAQILEDIPKSFALSEDGVHRKDMPVIPRDVIREAVVNALMHRNWQRHQAVQVVRYANRIEITNPGCSLVPEERLGEPGSSVARNPFIAAVLHDVGLAETKGTGIRAMREAMERANLAQPLLESDRIRNTFTVRLFVHHLLTQEDWDWLRHFRQCHLSDDEARALVIVRELGAIDNAVFRSITRLDTLTASRHLSRLRDLNLLKKMGSGSSTYYVPGEALTEAESRALIVKNAKRAMVTGTNPPDKTLSGELNPPDKGLSGELNLSDKALSEALKLANKTQALGLTPLPSRLALRIMEIKRRTDPIQLKTLIRDLCAWQSLQASQLAALLDRNQKYLVTDYLQPMINEGQLWYVHPDNIAHPRQAYAATEQKKSP